MKFLKLFSGCVFLLLFFMASSQTAEVGETLEEIVVVGRQPGPPMWRVSKGDHVLWIFPHLSPVPKDMIWETDKVAVVIAKSQEAIGLPRVYWTASPLLLLNPVNIFRGLRLAKRLSRNPDGATLEEVLPAELYARFAALQAKHFPREDAFEKMRPMVAGGWMSGIIQKEEGLVPGADILKRLRRLIRRNRDIERTEVEVKIDIEGNYRSVADRAETFMKSLAPEWELACFEEQVRSMEQDLDAMKLRANAWAQGYVDEIRNLPAVEDFTGACAKLMLGSTEQELLVESLARANRLWLEAAERALASNLSTFAILPINNLVSQDGLLGQLKAKGYEVREP